MAKLRTSGKLHGKNPEFVKICMMHISENPDNLSHAFRMTEEDTGFPKTSIATLYYKENSYLRNAILRENMFRLVTGKGEQLPLLLKNNIKKGVESLSKYRKRHKL